MKIPYASKVYDFTELKNIDDAAKEFWLTHGKYCNEFEKLLSDYIGTRYCSFVNSGSSANLLAFMALTQPELGDRRIKRGDEVITTACCFPTTVSPIINYGAIPVFVDITIPEYNVDVSQLEQALSRKTKAVILAHTLGNPFNVKAVKEFCNKHNLWLIEDCCDAIGGIYEGQNVGTFGDISTFSFYPAHHITTGEGGACCTNNTHLYDIMLSLRDWGRECTCMSGKDNRCGNRFSGEYDHKYVYSHMGYNLKATEFQGAIGCAQIKKLPEIKFKRLINYHTLRLNLMDIQDLILTKLEDNSIPNWFGFVVTLKKGDRNDFAEYLEANGIQTRPVFAGNILKQPCMRDIEHRKIGNLENSDMVYYNTLWWGLHSKLSQTEIRYICDKVRFYFS